MSNNNTNPTAAIIIIGNEILSGRVIDANTNYIAQQLQLSGINLREVRIIPDDVNEIIETINVLRVKYNYIYTTGGIGPTHDDVTTKAISMAFNVPLEMNKEILKLLIQFSAKNNIKINDSIKKMSYLPVGSKIIKNIISAAPGFSIENVFVLAGVTNIMKLMLTETLSNIKTTKTVKSKSFDLMVLEGQIAKDFEILQLKFPDIDMGSYPFKKDNNYGTSLVLSSNDYDLLETAYKELINIFKTIK